MKQITTILLILFSIALSGQDSTVTKIDTNHFYMVELSPATMEVANVYELRQISGIEKGKKIYNIQMWKDDKWQTYQVPNEPKYLTIKPKK